MFNKDETLAFIYDEYVNVQVPEIIKNPYVIARTTGSTSSKLDRSVSYIVHLEKHEFLNNTLTFLNSSTFRIYRQSQNCRYLVIINEKDVKLQDIFKTFWNMKIYKVVVLTRHSNKNKTYLKIHTSSPFHKDNYCGAYTNVIYSQDCNYNASINFSNIYNLNGCNITHFKHSLITNCVINYIDNLLKGFAEKVNGKYTIKLMKNRTEVANTIIQTFMGIGVTLINVKLFKLYDFSNTILTNKFVIIVKGGNTMSPIKSLFVIFKVEVWAMIILAIGITSLALWFILSLDNKRFNIAHLGEIWLNVYLATIWGYFAPLLKNSKARCVCICYLIYQLHIQTGFTSNLVTVLTTPQYEVGITNLEQIVESNLSIIANTYMEIAYFKDEGEPNSIYQKIRKQMQFMDYLSNQETAKLLNYGNYTKFLIDLEAQDFKFELGADLHINVIDTNSVTSNLQTVFALPVGHFLTENLNLYVRKLGESGILQKNINAMYDEFKVKPKFKKLVSLNLKHLSSAFVFLLFGMTIASVAFAIEIFHNKIK
ncbi:hypothetical protein RN001_012463 [Aquatica leii]|uniref:Ionotropic glutamate receptor C-terminal domain-containing protein n=1 Tax=Aquatica leii TaxID=1421715 RepID=A0AAN7P682_9COLE|nr:hypothetical protein RN001_012463 [Aquatica leii]